MSKIYIDTEHLRIFSRSIEEMKEEYEQEKNEILKQAYLEMYQMMIQIKGREELACDWKICLKDGTEIGGAGFKGLPDEKGNIEIGYGIDEPYQRKGYATEAVGALVKWGLEQAGVKYILGQTDIDNDISQKVLLKNGFVRNGDGPEGPMFEKYQDSK